MSRSASMAALVLMTLVTTARAAPATPVAKAPAAPPAAQPPAVEENQPSGFVAALKVGAVLPFTKLGVAPGVAIELGWILPVLDRALLASVETSYAQPTATRTVSGDARVGGDYTWNLTQRELFIMPTLTWRFAKDRTSLAPYVGLGARIALLESIASGTAGGQAISPTTEQSTKVGVGVPLGLEYPLGPGALLAEALFEWGPLNHTITGASTSTMGATLRLGYRFQP